MNGCPAPLRPEIEALGRLEPALYPLDALSLPDRRYAETA